MSYSVKIKSGTGATSYYQFLSNSDSLKCGPNASTTDTHDASFYVSMVDCTLSSNDINVSQTKKEEEPCNLSVSPTSVTIDSDGGNGSISVTSSTNFSASANVSWITVTTATSKVNYTIDKHTGTDERTGTIKIWNDCDSTGVSVGVTQSGADACPCSDYTLQVSTSSTGPWSTEVTLTFPQKGANNITAYVKSTNCTGGTASIKSNGITGDKSTETYANVQPTGVSISTSANTTTSTKTWTHTYVQSDCTNNEIKINCSQAGMGYKTERFILVGDGGGIAVSDGVPGAIADGNIASAKWCVYGTATLSNGDSVGLASDEFQTEAADFNTYSAKTGSSTHWIAAFALVNGASGQQNIELKTLTQVDSSLTVTSWKVDKIQMECFTYQPISGAYHFVMYENLSINMRNKSKITCSINYSNATVSYTES